MKEMAGLIGVYHSRNLRKDSFARRSENLQTDYGVVCVLEGCHGRWWQRRGRQMFLNTAGNSAMAKAGSGDVLAGVIAGLLAQHMTAYDADGSGCIPACMRRG